MPYKIGCKERQAAPCYQQMVKLCRFIGFYSQDSTESPQMVGVGRPRG